ncbi:MAG: hypothetical protein IPL41_00755 [Micropruina sp.]|nr:hypothetical protein [Micropruina sp.]
MTQTPSHYDGSSTFQRPDAVDAPDTDWQADPLRPSGSGTGDTADSSAASGKVTAKDEAGKVADSGVQAAKDVAGTAKDEASNVLAETKRQAKTLFESVRGEVTSQGGAQQQRLASGLQSIAQELSGMASGTEQSGPLTDLVEQAARKSGEFADWLESHEPADLLREVQSFARRRPVAFLALCGLAGVIAGRIARGATAAHTSLDSGSTDRPLPRLAATKASTDGVGTGYSGLPASPEVDPRDPLGTRFGDPAREAYESDLGATATRPGEVR